MAGVRSGEYQNQLYNSRLIANRLVVEALLPKVYDKAITIAGLIAEAVDPIVDNFFLDLSEHMGEPIDLAGQGVPGARPWNPLSSAYVKRKGNDMFWSYTHSLDARTLSTRLKISRRSKLVQRARDSSLISTFERLRGVRLFGPTVVRIMDEATGTTIETVTVQSPVGFVGKPVRGQKRTRRYETYTVDKSVTALRVKLSVRLWSHFSRSQIPSIEEALFKGGGVPGLAPGARTLEKLLGRSDHGARRPLIRPFMGYYSTVLIPKAIEDALKGRFPLSRDITVMAP